MADKSMAYDHPAYLVPHVFSGNTTVGANGVSQKFAAYTAMSARAVHYSPGIASTSASQPLMYTLSGTTTATTTLTALTSAARATITYAIPTPVALARGDQAYLTHGTDATAQLSFAIEATVTPGANVTA